MINEAMKSTNFSLEILGHQLTTLLPRTEVKVGDVPAGCVSGPPRSEQEGFVWHLSDASVVTDDPGKRCFPQGRLLGISEDSCVLPPEPENDRV